MDSMLGASSKDGFVCDDCLTDEEREVIESDDGGYAVWTPVFQSDDWFDSDQCVRCKHYVLKDN